MKKHLSLRWKLTLMTAFMVVTACLAICFFISRSAILYMDEIGNSAIAILPNTDIPTTNSDEIKVVLNPKSVVADTVKNTQIEFWIKSLAITLIITLTVSFLMYLIVGYALYPLRELTLQIEDIQAKNLKKPILSKSNSTEIERLTLAFNRLLLRLEETFATQRQFSANAAHELRTPLAVMSTKFEVFEKNKNPDEADYKEAIGMARSQTDRLSHVIDILLEMTELQSAPKSDSISLSEITEEVICDLVAVAEKKNISLVQDDGEARLTGSDTLVYRAIYNLIENAIKYNKNDGKVSIAITEDEDFAKVIITDTGSGIAKEDWDKIFEPFFRVDKSRSRSMGGAGLGLALVKEIAVRHGGDVKVVESSDRGSSIELSLSKNNN
ncbi:sensor histidine kinase [Catonella massiliensis]|uniref:histidine kinase n=1 Tax=Catonella massiliensis TaxID=2799636 RepID=A0ABS1J1I9_9FIRM|nr:ATP-binding protein [Catonella massiliensis]MBK5898014.1 HAMP domain-containing protein [Catonella massiliensis]